MSAPVDPDYPEPDKYLRPPWDDEQVTALNRFQTAGQMHPFTCGRPAHDSHPVLVATSSGWVCAEQGCDYTQDWAWWFMAIDDLGKPMFSG